MVPPRRWCLATVLSWLPRAQNVSAELARGFSWDSFDSNRYYEQHRNMMTHMDGYR